MPLNKETKPNKKYFLHFIAMSWLYQLLDFLENYLYLIEILYTI